MKPICLCLYVEKAGKDEVSSGRRGKSSFFGERLFSCFIPAKRLAGYSRSGIKMLPS